jgi:Transglutaminase-like superfamily
MRNATVSILSFRLFALVCCFFATVASTHDSLMAQDTISQVPSSASAKSTKAKGISKATEEPEESESAVTFIAPKRIEMLIGLSVSPIDGNLVDTSAQTVFPTDWPEQKVEILEINVPQNIKLKWRDLPGNNKQMLLFAPMLAPGTTEATIKVAIEKKHIVAPVNPNKLVIPKKLSSNIKNYMGSSPYIDPGVSEIKKVAKQIADSEPLTDWKRVEMLYDWVRDNIAYENGKLKTVSQALKDRKGDCEEMTSIFVALCRASRVPARCVWIPNHCYPEFYLEDEKGDGHWFPCQVAGTRNFGNMPEYLPILQKGDRFKVPERNEQLRYLQDLLSSSKNLGKKDPKVVFIRQLLGDAANLPPPDLDGSANLNTTGASGDTPKSETDKTP